VILDESRSEEERQDAELALSAHKELQKVKGERFWTTHKNAACACVLRRWVLEFLTERKKIKDTVRGYRGVENKLEKDVREMADNQIVRTELKAHSVFYFGLFAPALALVKTLRDQQGVAEVICLMEAFLVSLINRPETMKSMLAGGGKEPVTFLRGSYLATRVSGPTETTASIWVHNTRAEDIDNDVLAVLLLQAAEMIKTTRNMSAGLLANKVRPPKWTCLPSVVTWLQPCAKTGFRMQVVLATLPDNIGNESAFAYADRQWDKNKNFNVLRINGMPNLR
jgi:hypothetical protein